MRRQDIHRNLLIPGCYYFCSWLLVAHSLTSRLLHLLPDYVENIRLQVRVNAELVIGQGLFYISCFMLVVNRVHTTIW